MHVTVNDPTTQLTLTMDFPGFLNGPIMSHLAAVNNDCDPTELVRDYLRPGVGRYDDEEEIADAVEEACVLACDAAPYGCDVVEPLQVTRVELEAEDIQWARQQLLGLQFASADHLPLDAA